MVGSTTTQNIAFYRILVTETSVIGVMKVGNIEPRAGIEHKYLAFQASMPTITPNRLAPVTTLPTPVCI